MIRVAKGPSFSSLSIGAAATGAALRLPYWEAFRQPSRQSTAKNERNRMDLSAWIATRMSMVHRPKSRGP